MVECKMELLWFLSHNGNACIYKLSEKATAQYGAPYFLSIISFNEVEECYHEDWCISFSEGKFPKLFFDTAEEADMAYKQYESELDEYDNLVKARSFDVERHKHLKWCAIRRNMEKKRHRDYIKRISMPDYGCLGFPRLEPPRYHIDGSPIASWE